jgi:hypothetical protein
MLTRDDITHMAREAGFSDKQSEVYFDRMLQRFTTLVAAAERTRACRIVTGLCISDNNAREICEAIRMQAADRLARHGIHLPDEDEEYGNPSF